MLNVDAGGVAEAEVTTQGGANIVVSIPGVPDQATLERIRSSAKLEFRAVLQAGIAVVAEEGEEGAHRHHRHADATIEKLHHFVLPRERLGTIKTPHAIDTIKTPYTLDIVSTRHAPTSHHPSAIAISKFSRLLDFCP
jgi:preprotein translocase subunit SecD